MDSELDDYGVRKTYEEDMRLLRPLIRTQMRGVLIDQLLFRQYQSQLDRELAEASAILKDILGADFNPKSGKQLRKLLFEDAKLEPIGFTKTHQPRIDLDAILILSEKAGADLEPLLRVLIEFRKIEKIRSTYFNEIILDSRGRIHTQYTIHVTPTGRLSSRNPNLQNVPKKGTPREIFISSPGYSFISRDYSQIELRYFAIETNDQILMDVFAEGGDPHSQNAMDLFNISKDKVDDEIHRDFAKNFMYGAILYGGTAATVRRLSMSKVLRRGGSFVPTTKEIEVLQSNYLIKHPNIIKWQREIDTIVLRDRKLTNVFGRVRHFLGRPNDILRAAYNFPFQSVAAYIINRAYCELDKLIPEPDGIAMQVHDELVFEVRDNFVDEYIKVSKEVMERPVMIRGKEYVFPTSCKIGKSWGKMEKV